MWTMNHGVWCSFRCLGVHISQQWPSANHPGAFHSVLLAVSEDSHWMDICPAVTDSSFCSFCLSNLCMNSAVWMSMCALLSCWQCHAWLPAHQQHSQLCAVQCRSVKLFWLLFCLSRSVIDLGGAVNVYWTSICSFRLAVQNENLKLKLAQLNFEN